LKDLEALIAQLQSGEPEANGQIQSKSAPHVLTVPSKLHITCCFIGKKKEKFLEVLKSTDFREGEHYSVSPTHLAYLPSKLLVLKCTVEGSQGKDLVIENSHAHVTLGFAAGQGKNSIKPKQSNDLLEACDKAQLFESKANGGSAEIVVQQKMLNIQIGAPGTQKQEVYVMNLVGQKEKQHDFLMLDGVTKVVN